MGPRRDRGRWHGLPDALVARPSSRIRIFQADYEYMHANWGLICPTAARQHQCNTFEHGHCVPCSSSAPPPPIDAGLLRESRDRSIPGDPVTVTATAGGLNPKDHVVYSWSGEGVTGSDTTAKVDTSALAPGQYTVTGDGEGRQAGQGRPEALGDGDMHRGHYREGVRAADHQLLGQPQHDCAGRHGDCDLSGREPAEPSADLQLLGHGGHGDGKRNHGGILVGGRANRSRRHHLQCVG